MSEESMRADDTEDDDYESSSEQDEPLDLTTDERRLVTQPYDLGVQNISRDIEAGRISLTIEYQRKYVWDLAKASRLIESLLLNVPIPVCYFAEDESGRYEVIDGLQRLTTIKNFLENDFALTGLSVLTELDGKRFGDLTPKDRRRLENRTIRCIVITEDSNPDIKFDVFERLNTGAAMLTAQELRNSVYRGPFNDELKRLASEEAFTELVGTTSNRRMDFEEIILRFFALVEGLEKYKPALRQFLNDYMRSHRSSIPDPSQIDIFRKSCAIVHEVLGPAPFKVAWSRNKINKGMYDAIMVPTAFADKTAMREHADEVRQVIADLEDDAGFRTSIGRATADRRRMLYRIGIVAERFRAVGVPVALREGLGLDEPETSSL